MAILFFSDGIDFHLSRPRITTAWIKNVVKKEKKSLHSLSYVFSSDAHLVRLNRQYLNHNTLTDILTFDYSVDPNSIQGEIYVSARKRGSLPIFALSSTWNRLRPRMARISRETFTIDPRFQCSGSTM